MKKHVRRVILDLIGWILIVLGIFGIFLPFLQGFIMIALGIYFLSLNSVWFDSILKKFLRRHPKFANVFNKVDSFVKRILQKIRLHEMDDVGKL